MLFNSLEFIIFLTTVLVLIYLVKSYCFRYILLLLSSYFFFYFSSNYLIILLVYSSFLDFFAAKEIQKSKNSKKRKIIFLLSLIGNLSLLGFFKYVDFGIGQINYLNSILGYDSLSYLNLILPIGISFYTFQTISYTTDVYRGKLVASNSLKEYLLFVSFFPQLVAGPIIRATDFFPQVREKFSKYSIREKFFDEKNLKIGISMISIGLLSKVFFADNIAIIADDVFTGEIVSSSLVWLGTIAFGFQIFGDFSGYSLIAIGTARILGFKFPENFNNPYFAISPSDFWRRWHISLSNWLRDYLYIPLGGNKKSKKRTYLNLVIVMVLGGLWHGAAWNFVIWGMLHGGYLGLHKLLKDKFPKFSKSLIFKTNGGKIFSIIVTQYLVFLAWIPFRVTNYEDSVQLIFKYVFFDFEFFELINFIKNHEISGMIMFSFLIFIIINYKINITEKLAELKLKHWYLVLITILFICISFFVGDYNNFIYFRF